MRTFVVKVGILFFWCGDTEEHNKTSQVVPDTERIGMKRFRYRNKALAGPWRSVKEEAVADALRANQASRNPHQPEEIVWRHGTRVEEEEIFGTPFFLGSSGLLRAQR